MSLLFVDGFDHFSAATTALKYANAPNTAYTAMVEGRRPSSLAIRLRNSSAYLYKTLPSTEDTLIVGFAYKATSLYAGRIISFRDSAGGYQATLTGLTTGVLQARRGEYDGTLLQESSDFIVADSWNYIEIKLTVHDTTGLFEVRVNGVVWISYTGDTKGTAVAGVTSLAFGPTTTNSAYNHYDDLYVCSTDGSTNNDYLGDCRVDTLLPTEAGTYAQFTPTGSANNWANVDEVPPDNNTSYNSGDTAGMKDSFGFTTLSGTGATIFGIQTNLIARKDDAGTRTLMPLVRSGGTDANGAAQSLGDSYVDQMTIFETDPTTSTAWTESAINAAEFGYEVAA
jgi:hypothetical protein